MKTIRVSDQAHNLLVSIAAYLTLAKNKQQSIGNAVEEIVFDYLKDHSIQSKKPIEFKKVKQ